MRYGRAAGVCFGLASILAGQIQRSINQDIHGAGTVADGNPVGLSVKAIAANGNHSLALDSDGKVWEWGGKWSAPTRVSGLTGIVSVAAAFDYGLAVKSDGTVWAWGANQWGQLGNGTTPSPGTPSPTSTRHL